MRVLFLTDSLSDLDGVGRYGLSLIQAMERREPGLEVEVLLARKHRPTSPSVPAHWRVSVGLPPDYFFYMKPTRFWPSLWGSVRRVAAAAKNADLVHAIKDYPHNLVGLAGARKAGVPCIATAHGTYSVQPLAQDRHRKRALSTYHGFAKMIAVSEYTQRRVLEACAAAGKPLPEDRIEFIPNAVDAEYYVPDPEVGKKPWHDHRFTLSIAEVKERKGLHLAVEAWARIAREDLRLHHYIVGKASGDGYQSQILKMTAGRGRLAERLHFLGNVEEAEKIDLLKRCRALLHTPVLASDGGFEGFGIVYLEAGACGVPVIGTLHCGAEDAIVDGETGFLVEPEVDAVEGALRKLLEDDATRDRLGAGGLAHAQRSSWDENAERVLGIYRSALR